MQEIIALTATLALFYGLYVMSVALFDGVNKVAGKVRTRMQSRMKSR